MDIEFWAHVGIYAYQKDFLCQYISWSPSKLEQSEQLEQLRVLENGYSIRVMETDYAGWGVDTPGDAVKIEEMLVHGKEGVW